MRYFDISLIGLNGRLHPAASNVSTSHNVKKMRPHLKMLAGHYLTYEDQSLQSGGSPLCRLCSEESLPESLEHLISRCSGLLEIRKSILESIQNLCENSGLNIKLNNFSHSQLTQFLLDPSSNNLRTRVNINHPVLPSILQLSRDFCYAIDRKRLTNK